MKIQQNLATNNERPTKFIGLCTALVLTLAASVSPVFAQEQSPEQPTEPSPEQTALPPLSDTGVVALFGALIRFPLPDWIDFSDPATVISQSNYRRESVPNRFSIEQIPLGENFETYTNLMSLSASQGEDISLEDALSNMFMRAESQCKSERFQTFASSPQPDMVLFTMVCGEQADAGANAFGSVTHGRLDHEKGLTIIVAREWRGDPFEPGDMSGATPPPVTDEAFANLSDRLLNEMDVIAP